MAKVITISSQKGGVGKTTTSVNLGVGLARQSKKTLIVDFDPQGSLSASLGWREPDKLTVTSATVMNNIINEIVTEPKFGILRHSENVDILPANIDLSAVEIALVNAISRETVLRQYIDTIKHEYEYIIIDCCPSLGMLTVNALTAADSIIIPVAPKYLDEKGLELLLKTVSKVKRQLNPALMIEGILVTMCDTRTNYTKDIMSLLYAIYKEKIKIFCNKIPQSVRVTEASAAGVSIYVHEPSGKAALAYESLVREVLDGEK